MKVTLLVSTVALAFPALAVKPDDAPAQYRSGTTIHRPVDSSADRMFEERAPRERRMPRDAEPPRGDTLPGGPSAARRDPHDTGPVDERRGVHSPRDPRPRR